MSDFGLPEPKDIKTELEIGMSKYDPHYQAQLLESLEESAPNNLEQEEIFSFVKSEVNNIRAEQTSFIFINGPAGTYFVIDRTIRLYSSTNFQDLGNQYYWGLL